jgi:FKBP-type peptidyl-prolyl cis-trans isomerase 2
MVEDITLVNLVSNEAIKVNKLDSDFVLDTVDWGTIKSKNSTVRYIDQIGEQVVGQALQSRSITITGWIIGESEDQIREYRKLLSRMINPKQQIEIEYGDYVLDMLPDNSIKYSVKEKENNEVLCKFTIDGTSYNPLFRLKKESEKLAASIVPKFRFPLVIPQDTKFIFGLRQPSLIVNVENIGTVKTGMKILFRAKANGVKNPKLINAITQEEFMINKVLAAGEEVIINTNIGSKSVKGYVSKAEYNYFKYKDIDSAWLQLEVGDNLFKYEAEEKVDQLEVVIYHNDSFMEVM